MTPKPFTSTQKSRHPERSEGSRETSLTRPPRTFQPPNPDALKKQCHPERSEGSRESSLTRPSRTFQPPDPDALKKQCHPERSEGSRETSLTRPPRTFQPPNPDALKKQCHPERSEGSRESSLARPSRTFQPPDPDALKKQCHPERSEGSRESSLTRPARTFQPPNPDAPKKQCHPERSAAESKDLRLTPTNTHQTSFLHRHIFTTDHRAIGRQYLILALISVAIGTILSLLMRLHLTWPDIGLPGHGPILPEDYLALVTFHGTLMIFYVLTTAPQSGFGNLILPSQIGARHMAFPRLNAAAFWLTATALVTLLSATFAPGGGPISGWTAYPPLSAVASAGPGQGLGMDLWLTSLALFSIATTIASVNTLTTVIRNRCDGMTWERLPLTVWGWFTAALLSLLAFSVLLAALLLLFCDRHAATSFFIPTGDLTNSTLHGANQTAGNGSPLLWLHLFWFFGHPEVYIAILPGMGLTSMILGNFSRRKIFGYRIMILTTLLIGFLGILVWGHHMFVAGLNPFAGTAFSISTMAIAIPAAAKVLSWLATIWRSRPEYKTAMLFALGFVSLFVTGGLTGPILAQPILDQYLHNTFFVVAHFHLIMAMAGVFGLYAATYYWFPQITASATHPGRLMSEPLGRLHFWGTFLGAYATFLPMHITGLEGEPRHYAQLTGIPNQAGHLLATTLPLQHFITWSAVFLAAAQLPFLLNLVLSLRNGKVAPPNPWQATTLEWAPHPSPDETIAVYRAPCQYPEGNNPATFLPQWVSDPIPE